VLSSPSIIVSAAFGSPAMVVTAPVADTLRIAWLNWSSTNRSKPTAARSKGLKKRASGPSVASTKPDASMIWSPAILVTTSGSTAMPGVMKAGPAVKWAPSRTSRPFEVARPLNGTSLSWTGTSATSRRLSR